MKKTQSIDDFVLSNYMKNLVNQFFKILPIKESDEPSLTEYMESLQAEMLGCERLVSSVNGDPLFLSLVSILQFLIDTPDANVRVVKREVFKSISICNKLKARYSVKEVHNDGL